MNQGSILDGHLKLYQKIGQGSYSEVYAAEDAYSHKKYCVKIYNSNSSIQIEKDEKEIGIKLSKLDHPNILKVFTYNSRGVLINKFQKQSCRYLLTQYLSQQTGNLFELLQCFRNSLSFDSIGVIFSLLLSGIHEMHRANIAHVDIKPNNVLLYRDYKGWNLKIIDLNSAINEEGSKILIKQNCTSQYCPPQHFKENNIKWQSYRKYDDYAAGKIFVELIMGGQIYNKATKQDKIYQKLFSQNKLVFFSYFNKILREIGKNPSLELVQLIKNMIEPFPSQRWSVQDAINSKWMKSEFSREVFNKQMELFSKFLMEKRKIKESFEGIDDRVHLPDNNQLQFIQ